MSNVISSFYLNPIQTKKISTAACGHIIFENFGVLIISISKKNTNKNNINRHPNQHHFDIYYIIQIKVFDLPFIFFVCFVTRITMAMTDTKIQDNQTIDKKEDKGEYVNQEQIDAQREYDELLDQYDKVIGVAAGNGMRGQRYIDSAYIRLAKFARKHSYQLNRTLPRRYICRDDGCSGMPYSREPTWRSA